jgi:Domain of unknown function (DUF4926)
MLNSHSINLLDVVALTVDLPQANLWRGQVGTVVEMLGGAPHLRWSLAIGMVALMSLWDCAQTKLWCCILSQHCPIGKLNWRWLKSIDPESAGFIDCDG